MLICKTLTSVARILANADLSHANLSNANLQGATLNGAKLDRTNFCGATLPDGTKGGC